MHPPLWCRKIIAFRDLLADSQQAFGKRLSVSAMTVSRWESGQQAPSSRHYIELGNLSENPECWYYWGLAGLTRKRVSDALARVSSSASISMRAPRRRGKAKKKQDS